MVASVSQVRGAETGPRRSISVRTKARKQVRGADSWPDFLREQRRVCHRCFGALGTPVPFLMELSACATSIGILRPANVNVVRRGELVWESSRDVEWQSRYPAMMGNSFISLKGLFRIQSFE